VTDRFTAQRKLATVNPTHHIAAMEEIFMLRRRQRGGFMAHRPDCHEFEDVVKTEVQARPWFRKQTLQQNTGRVGRRS